MPVTTAPGNKRAPVPSKHLGYQQQRSRETFHKLIRAAEELIVESSFESASVVNIASRAGVSVGAFYRRFKSKEGLLHFVHERYTTRMCRAQDEMFAQPAWSAMTLEQVLHAWIETVISTTSQHLPLITACARRGQTDAMFAAREEQIRSATFRGVLELFHRRADEITHPHPNTALPFAAAQLTLSLHYRFLHSHLRADGLSDAEWSTELVGSIVRYLIVVP